MDYSITKYKHLLYNTVFVTSVFFTGCASFSSDIVREMPTQNCLQECGENANCSNDICICDEGFYGNPLIQCEEVVPHQDWIGSPCTNDAACPYDGGFCLTEEEGYPDGQCSQWCDQFCPDMDGMPITFCIEPIDEEGGFCFSRCDIAQYPYTDGCRPDYACVPWARVGTTDEIPTCVPAEWLSSD